MKNQKAKVAEETFGYTKSKFEKINIERMGENRPVLQLNECTCGGDFDEFCYCGGYSEDSIDVVVRWNNGTFTFHPNSPNNVHDLFEHIDDQIDFPVLAEIAAVPIYLAEGDFDPGRCVDTEHLKFVPGRVFFSWREPKEPVDPCSIKETNAT